MIKRIILYLIITGMIPLQAQELMVSSPYQLGMSTSTARIDNWQFANSALAQSFYRQNAYASLSYYTPYQELSDGNIGTNAVQVFLPSYRWGAVNFSYTQFSVENFDNPVIDASAIEFGYANAFFKRLIVAASLKWNDYTWYSDINEDETVSGVGGDLSAIYVLDGYQSVGFSAKNLFSPSYSSVSGDNEAREFRTSYLWLNESNSISLEGGAILEDDYYLDRNFGAFINAKFDLPSNFSLGVEYKKVIYNEIGALLAFKFHMKEFSAHLTYGVRYDDSPLPVSTLRQAWGIQFSVDRFHGDAAVVNPQLVYRDKTAPQLHLDRLGNYTVFTRPDTSDIFRIHISARDEDSGLSLLNLSIVSAEDSSIVAYRKSYNLRGGEFDDSLSFNGIQDDGRFVRNMTFVAGIEIVDKAGNSSSETLPFKVLSLINDSNPPEINLEFDTTGVKLEPFRTDYILTMKADIRDEESERLNWKIQLYKSGDDSVWSAIRPLVGDDQVINRSFKWLLRDHPKNPITASYKIKVEASDELENYAMKWTGVKNIFLEKPEIAAPEKKVEVITTPQPVEDEKNAIFYLDESPGPVKASSAKKQMKVSATYFYRDNEIKLTDFVFSGNDFDVNSNMQSLSVVGVYLQDLPASRLVIEYPQNLSRIRGFEEALKAFFEDVYGVSPDRVRVNVSSSSESIHFIIKE
ncbi:MAG: hypothetical protein AB7T22_02320 [Calditrichaceae bacterium]